MNLVEKEDGLIDFIRRENGQATRLRARKALLELAMSYGITPGNWSTHFRPAPISAKVPNPITVRGKKEFWHDDIKGPKLRINKTDPAYAAAAKQVQDFNAYVARQTIAGCDQPRFRRIYSYGDQPGFRYNMGGRFYVNGGGYQQMKGKDRALITINGEPVIELDIRASHLTIIYAVAGIFLDPAHDPYTMAWPPRDVAKAWTTMALGYGDFQKRWSDETKKKLKEKKGINVDDYPIEQVKAAMFGRHPILQDWPTSKLRWPELQYRESEVVRHTVKLLAFDHNVLALPVHDSIIVPASCLMLAKRVLESAFRQKFKMKTVLTIKRNDKTVTL